MKSKSSSGRSDKLVQSSVKSLRGLVKPDTEELSQDEKVEAAMQQIRDPEILEDI